LRIVNTTNRELFLVFHKYQSILLAPAFSRLLEPGQEVEHGMGEDEVYITIYDEAERNASITPVSPIRSAEDTAPFSNTTCVLITEGGRTVVDWNALREKYEGAEVAWSASDRSAMAQASQTARNTVTSLGLALEKFGGDKEIKNPKDPSKTIKVSTVKKAIGAGIASAVPLAFELVSLLVDAFTDDPVASYPVDAPTVEAIVQRVVREELQKDRAIEYTGVCIRAQSFLAEQLPLVVAGPHQGALSADFRDHLEKWSDGELQNAIAVLNEEPAIARWMIVPYIAGIGAALHIRRLHDMIRFYSDGYLTIVPQPIIGFRNVVKECRDGLHNTVWAWDEYARDILRREHIYDNPNGTKEEWEIYWSITESVHGVQVLGPTPPSQLSPDPLGHVPVDSTPVGGSLNALDTVLRHLDEDLAKMKNDEPPTYYWSDFGAVEQWGAGA